MAKAQPSKTRKTTVKTGAESSKAKVLPGILKPKTDGQANFIRTIAENILTICQAPAGTGKAGSLDSLIYTPTGPVKMGDIKLGQLVCTPDGDYAMVLGIYPQGKKEIFKVTFSDGSSTECCKEHLWLTKTSLDRDAKRAGSVKSLEEISKTLKYGEKRNHSIPMSQPVFFHNQELPIDPYVLGLLLGDGSMGKVGTNIGFSSADNSIIESMSSGLATSAAVLKKNGSGIDYYINGIDFKKKINELGLRGKNSDSKFIPDIYKINSVENRLAIFQGLMDSDGTVNRGNISFTSTSKKLAEDVLFLVQSLGGVAKIKSRIPKYTYLGEKKSGKIAYTVFMSLPNYITPFRLERKLEKVIPKTKYFPSRFIDKVESIGFKEAQCIYVDSEDHLYLTDNFIVTHNTHISVGMACEYLQDGKIDRIVVTRPLVQCGPGMGHLPGTAEAKADPFMRPVLDALNYFLTPDVAKKYITNKMIEIIPIEVMRGDNFHNAFIILDEMQNCSYMQLKMFATRLGDTSKCVISGDLRQSDLDKSNFSNSDVIKTRFIEALHGGKDIGFCELGIEDIVRGGITKTIVTRLS